MGATGPRALVDASFSSGLLIITIVLGTAIGRKILSGLRLGDLTGLEQILFALPIGLGSLAYGVLGLGLVGLLNPWTILIWLTLICLWSWKEWTQVIEEIPQIWAWGLSAWRNAELSRKVLLTCSGCFLLLVAIQALAPPWAYDALMYHLQGPKLFLQAGRILPLPEVWGANGPFTIEMLYTIGLGFATDSFANLMHLTYAVLLVASTVLFGERFLKKDQGWIAGWIFLGIPIFPIWASFAYSDIAWAVYEFLGVYAFFSYIKSNRKAWLIVCGVLTGFALGSKYMALAGAGVVGLGVIWFGLRKNIRQAVIDAGIYGLVAILVGCPWYIKNWLWLGNPVFPLFFPSGGWSQERMNALMVYLNSYGTGHSIQDYILSPWYIYTQNSKFASMYSDVDILSFLFPLLIFLPLVRRSPLVTGLSVLTLFRYIAWLFGSHQIRFLLPLIPELSLLTGVVLLSMDDRPSLRRLVRLLVAGVLGGTVILSLIFSALNFYVTQPLNVLLGLTSKDQFLQRVATTYRAMQFIQSHVESGKRVLMLWDGRGYYCDDRCIPDTDQSRWPLLIKTIPDSMKLAKYLRNEGISYILYNLGDLNFILKHDPTLDHQRAADFFENDFRPACTRQVYSDRWVRLYEITCR